MIALINVRPPIGQPGGVVELERRPAAPAIRYAGAIVGCSGIAAVRETLGWFKAIREVRPAFVLGLVSRPRHCARALGSFTYPVKPVISPAELENGHLPQSAVDIIRELSIEGLILEEFVAEHGDRVLSRRLTLECLIAHAIRGGTLNAVVRDLGCSPTTVWRQVGDLGLRPSTLMRWARLRAYQLRIELGVRPGAALKAGGWNEDRARRKAASRWSVGRT
jgi:hypothetical protein